MESMFQFTNPALTGLEFGLNEGFNSKENKERNGAGTKLKNNKDNPEPQANIQSK